MIIDEISMVDGHLLNKLNEIAKTLRRNNRPFGGIQLVACGDFYQLPPVVKKTAHDGTEVDNVEVYFAFESLAWKETIQRTITLKEIFRQKGDQRFIDMLNNLETGMYLMIRLGILSSFSSIKVSRRNSSFRIICY